MLLADISPFYHRPYRIQKSAENGHFFRDDFGSAGHLRTETARASVLPSEHTITTAQQFIPITPSSRQTATLSLAEESSPSRHPASSRAAIAAATAERISLFTVFFIFNHFTTLTLSVNSTPCSSRTRSK